MGIFRWNRLFFFFFFKLFWLFFSIVSHLQTHLYFKEDSSWSLTETIREEEGKHTRSERAAGNFGPVLPSASEFHIPEEKPGTKQVAGQHWELWHLPRECPHKLIFCLFLESFFFFFFRWEMFIPETLKRLRLLNGVSELRTKQVAFTDQVLLRLSQ